MARKLNTARMLDVLESRGFDNSYETENGVRVACSQCDALTINGHATHETGCPNQPVPCRECEDEEEDQS